MSTPPFDTGSASQSSLLSPRELTGVPRLDLVLGGGLLRGALTMIVGPPGSGKTTLASQIIFAAARRGQQTLLLTALSESTSRLLEHLRSYSFFAPDLVGNGVQVFSLQQFLSQNGFSASQEIVAAVRQTKAQFVLLDGFQGLRGLEADFVETRKLLYNLGTRLSLLGTTTLITTEGSPRDPLLFPEMTAADVLIGMHNTLVGARVFRSMEAIKVRGQAPLLGRHSFSLSERGVEVFPRLETQVKSVDSSSWDSKASSSVPQERAMFGLAELDDLLNGGLNRQTGTLLTGSLGTGKTLLALHFALEGVQKGEHALYLGFRETAEQLIHKADHFAMGEQLRTALAPNGGLALHRWEPIELNPDQIAIDVLETVERSGTRRLVIDSIAELERAIEESSGPARVANYLSALLASLRARGVTLLAVKETAEGIATRLDFLADKLAVLAENVLVTHQLAVIGQLHRVLSVLKMRFSAHDSSLREFQIVPPEGIRVLTPKESGPEMLFELVEMQGDIAAGTVPPIDKRPSFGR